MNPDYALLRLAGQRLLIIAANGAEHEGIIVVALSRNGPLRFSVRIINDFRSYLTEKAVKMLKPNGVHKGPEWVLSFAP